jgi:hypothetical protein
MLTATISLHNIASAHKGACRGQQEVQFIYTACSHAAHYVMVQSPVFIANTLDGVNQKVSLLMQEQTVKY